MSEKMEHIKMESCARVVQTRESESFYRWQYKAVPLKEEPLRIPNVAHGLAPLAVPELVPVALLSPEVQEAMITRIRETRPYYDWRVTRLYAERNGVRVDKNSIGVFSIN